MATVAESTSSPPSTPSTPSRLAVGSLVGALAVLVGIAIVGYFIPQYWAEYVTPQLAGGLGAFLDIALRMVAQFAVGLGLVLVIPRLAGDNPPLGLRGGITIAISWIITTFFVVRASAMLLEESGIIGQAVTGAILAGMVFLGYRLLTTPSGQSRAIGIDEGGWLHTFSYKKTQGLKMRRYTLLGFLVLGWTGVYSLAVNETLGRGDWLLAMPYELGSITLFKDLQYSVPVVLAGVVLWLSWRAVNMPTFADFLIATEAEMNKVSWTTRKRLVQDTIVVLATLFLMSTFLFMVDWFWGTALSWKPIGVLPSQKETTEQIDPLQGRKLDW